MNGTLLLGLWTAAVTALVVSLAIVVALLVVDLVYGDTRPRYRVEDKRETERIEQLKRIFDGRPDSRP